MSTKKNTETLKIITNLGEIYPKEIIEKNIESQYEDLRSKYNYLYKTDPTAIIRVPYTVTLFGDLITEQFPNKVVGNLSSELILFFNKNKTNELNLKYFDYVQEIKTSVGEINNVNFSETELTLNEFGIAGYLNGLKQIKSENNFGSNILILLNTPNREEIDCYLTIFIAMFICGIYVNEKEDLLKKGLEKNSLYDMITLSLTEIFEQNKSIKNRFNISFYYPDIYFKIFLQNHQVGINQGNLYYQQDVIVHGKPLNMLVFDSFSPEPIKYYSSSKFWNKRKVELRISMALVIKRYQEKMSQEEIIKNSSSIDSFLKIFDNNIDGVLKAIDIYIKKEAYNLSEVKSELGINIDLLLKDIPNYQGALLTKEFKLYDRITFLIKEFQIVSVLYYKSKIGENIDWLQELNESAKLLRDNYNCYSEEMLNHEAELKIKFGEDIPIKCISKGWSGKMILCGEKEDVAKYEEFEMKKIEKLIENPGDGLASAWITDDLNQYCFISELKKGITILDPRFEDFMLEYVKNKNIIVPTTNENLNDK